MSYNLTDTARLSDIQLLGKAVKAAGVGGTGGGGKGFSVTLEKSSWLSPTGGEPEPVSSYSYRCFVPATSLGVTLSDNDRVDVMFDNSSLSTIQSNGDKMCPITVTTADGVYLFTNTMPTAAYTATFWVFGAQ